MFIVVEGNDGSGKTSLCQRLADWFADRGFTVVRTREPGGTELAEKFRSIVLNEVDDPLTQALLISAGRNEHMNYLNSLDPDSIIICDRYFFSTYAHQCTQSGLSVQKWDAVQRALDFRVPDLVLFLTVSYEVARSRISRRPVNEIQKVDFDNADHVLFRERSVLCLNSIQSFCNSGLIPLDGEQDPDRVFQQAVDAISLTRIYEHALLKK